MNSEYMLKLTLKINWIFSAASGLCLILFESAFRDTFNIQYTFSQTGISLLIFALILFIAERKTKISKALIYIIIAMDISWVLFSIVILFSGINMSSFGYWIVAMVAFIVLVFALFQWLGLRRILQLK